MRKVIFSMSAIIHIKQSIFTCLKNSFTIDDAVLSSIDIKLNLDKDRAFGDLSCNAAMVLAKIVGKNPRQIAEQIQKLLENGSVSALQNMVETVSIAGPGFINIKLTKSVWQTCVRELLALGQDYFKLDEHDQKRKYLIEFVSANPTGPLHLGHGRGGIIGDVLTRVLRFLGHSVDKEFYINDAGNQIVMLGRTFKARCQQALLVDAVIPEGGYQGEYLIELAKTCVDLHGKDLLNKDDRFFENYAREQLLENIKIDLKNYGVEFDTWFSEKTIHDNGAVSEAIGLLEHKGLAYVQDGALWFKSTEFGDDKDRVVRKQTGELTYIAGDIAYHKNKFDRGYDYLIDILGQDHHGYVKRLKATMQALGYDAEKLDVILYQLVTIKQGDEAVRMSKRAGNFTSLYDILDAVGTDVARFFYLNRKADAHLEFDLATALKKTDENPVFYIQYAYVRTKSVIAKASEHEPLQALVQLFDSSNKTFDHKQLDEILSHMSEAEIDLLAKILSLHTIVRTIASTYQMHMLAYYAWEIANHFHSYYAQHRVVDIDDIKTTELRLVMVFLVRQTLDLCLQLLGLSRPEKM